MKTITHLCLIGLITFSSVTWGSSNVLNQNISTKNSRVVNHAIPQIPPTNSHDMKGIILNSGDGYQLKNITYNNKHGEKQNIDLYFITSSDGAKNAYIEAGLPFDKRNEIMQAFVPKNNTCVKGKCASSSITKINSDTHYDVIVIDKKMAEATTLKEVNAVMRSRNINYQVPDHLNTPVAAKWGISKPKFCHNNWRNSHKKWSKSFDESINKSHRWGDISSVEVDLKVRTKGVGKVTFNYAYKKNRFCIPYAFASKKLKVRSDYKMTGTINIRGEAKKTLDGYSWDIVEPTLTSGIFNIGYIPVLYSIKLPISAGTGDLKLLAKGDLGVTKKLKIISHYEYACNNDSCAKVSSSFKDHGSVELDNIQHEEIASVKIEPWIQVAIKSEFYKGLFWVKAGVKPSLPIKLSSYYGNSCGDGDGRSGNERVKLGMIDINLRIGVIAQAKYFNEKYWEIYKKDIYIADLINPHSTALSPIIRPKVSMNHVSMPVSLRSCSQFIDQSYQDFTIHWGDGQTTDINNLRGTKTYSHRYRPSLRSFNISVQHKNGATTKRKIRTGRLSAPDNEGVFIGHDSQFNVVKPSVKPNPTIIQPSVSPKLIHIKPITSPKPKSGRWWDTLKPFK